MPMAMMLLVKVSTCYLPRFHATRCRRIHPGLLTGVSGDFSWTSQCCRVACPVWATLETALCPAFELAKALTTSSISFLARPMSSRSLSSKCLEAGYRATSPPLVDRAGYRPRGNPEKARKRSKRGTARLRAKKVL